MLITCLSTATLWKAITLLQLVCSLLGLYLCFIVGFLCGAFACPPCPLVPMGNHRDYTVKQIQHVKLF